VSHLFRAPELIYLARCLLRSLSRCGPKSARVYLVPIAFRKHEESVLTSYMQARSAFQLYIFERFSTIAAAAGTIVLPVPGGERQICHFGSEASPKTKTAGSAQFLNKKIRDTESENCKCWKKFVHDIQSKSLEKIADYKSASLRVSRLTYVDRVTDSCFSKRPIQLLATKVHSEYNVNKRLSFSLSLWFTQRYRTSGKRRGRKEKKRKRVRGEDQQTRSIAHAICILGSRVIYGVKELNQ